MLAFGASDGGSNPPRTASNYNMTKCKNSIFGENMPRKNEKARADEQNISFGRPFLIGLFIFAIVLVPLTVTSTLMLPLNKWFSLSNPLEPGMWVVYGTLSGLVMASILALLFARSISPASKGN